MTKTCAFRIYGYDAANMAGTAAVLKEYGFSSVVGHAPAKAAEFFAQNGLDCYAVQGCFSIDESIDSPENLCIDIEGNRTKWFGSACPNSPAAIQKCLAEAKRIAAMPHLSGIMIDGARFASPASAEGANAFFTCFCGHCQARMAEFGYLPQKIMASVSALYTREFNLDAHRSGILDWLEFRRRVITRHLTDYVVTIRAANPALKIGMYLFAPSIAPLVGQSYCDLSKIFDFLSPMLYRHYTEAASPACLDHEIIALLKPSVAFTLYEEITGLPFGEMPGIEAFKSNGCPVAYIEREVSKAVEQTAGGRADVSPIILLKDAALPECIRACVDHGIKTIDFFMYDREGVVCNFGTPAPLG